MKDPSLSGRVMCVILSDVFILPQFSFHFQMSQKSLSVNIPANY